MKRTQNLVFAAFVAAIVSMSATSLRAQNATWSGGASDGEWTTAGNWDIGVPAEGTNAIIPAGQTIAYDFPMVAGAFGTLTNVNSSLSINTNGFVVGGGTAVMNGSSARLFINTNGIMQVTNGGLVMSSSANGILAQGGSLTVSGTLSVVPIGSLTSYTNNGGTLTVGALSVNPGNIASNALFVINGGTNNLGNVIILRNATTSFGATPGVDGLVINNGVVQMSSLNVGTATANSYLTMLMTGGVVTNTGNFNVRLANNRGARFLQTGGFFLSSGAGGTQVCITNTGQTAIFSVTGGTNVTQGFVLGNVTNGSSGASALFTNSASIYIGANGIVSNAVNTLTVILNNGGTLGATADWVGMVPMRLNGGLHNFNAAGLDGTPHNITISNVLSSTGGPNKIGGGTLTLAAANTYSGDTVITAGTLALAATGTIANSIHIIVASGAVFDVSATSGQNLGGSQNLNGIGSVAGNLTAGSGSTINPAGPAVGGTLTFSNALVETGGTVNGFDLSTNASGLLSSNDFLHVVGDLDLTNVNTILVNPLGQLPSAATYKLIQYGGNFNGGLSNLVLSGAAGSLTLDSVAKTISLVTAGGVRNPTNVVWLGNPATNNWDLLVTSNWLNGVARDWFVGGDTVRFDSTGATNPVVNVVASVSPSSVTVDTSSNYTFSGSGAIAGSGGLTKTNSGTLTVLTTNGFTGTVIIGGGTIEATRFASGGVPSSIGAAGSDPTNLVFYGSTLRDLGGSASTDRGATLNDTGATIDVTNSGTTLTMSGTLTGPGALTKAGPGGLTLSGTGSYAGVTTISNGTLSITGSTGSIGAADIVFAGGTLSMNLGSQPTYPNNLDIVANSTIISGGGNNNIVSGDWTGTSPVVLSINMTGSNGTFSVNGSMSNFTGTVLLTQTNVNLQTFRFNGGGGNSTIGAPNATIDLGTNAGALQARNAASLIVGAVQGGPNTQILGQGAGTGNLTWAIGSNNLSTVFLGAIKDGAAANRVCFINKVGTGTWTLAGNNTFTGTCTISSGTIALTNSGTLSGTTNINFVAGTILDVSGRTNGTLSLNTNQNVTGTGTIIGSVTAKNGSTFSPDDSPNGNTFARLIITGSLVMQAGSTFNVDLDPANHTNDLISGMTSVTYGGTLNLNFFSTPTLGDSYKLFSAGSYSGGPFTIIPAIVPGSGGTLGWDQSHLTTDGTLRVSLPHATISSASLTGTTMSLSGTGGYPNGNFDVLVSTNIVTPLSSWVSLLSTQFDGAGGFSVQVSTNVGQAFFIIKGHP